MKTVALVSLLLAPLLAQCSAEPAPAPAPAAAEQHDRDDQWLYRDAIHDSGPPVAVFLSWNYAAVILRGYCDQKSRELVIEYELDPTLVDPDEQIVLIINDREFPMRTRREGNRLEGRLPVTPELQPPWAGSEVRIWAQNEMNEPWHVGRAEPLQRLAGQCVAKAP